ncbi:hypothetical protein B9Z65_8289 [Elsinoe australis]|uniref:Uncharacterized protein n=1 Tax=Elsinoe australis TaxID=40998 RepID=A0A2P7YDC1_9PEZI|nr:hypothetical protein B9Z65_8289 [Elsinoe australis]
MSKAINSPTARILRSSRFFCMPPPLPQPSVDILTSQGSVRTSDTATLPYPSKQAITAPASSRHRGDWGLKRPLPERTNNTSTPHVRINAMDTLEHITDFESAADHTLTLKKSQEMNVWMTQAHRRKTGHGTSLPSAFDEALDYTAIQGPAAARGAIPGLSETNINKLPLGVQRTLRLRSLNRVLQDQGQKPVRWKTDGPWLPAMSEIDFEKYLRDVVSRPKIREEFREFLLRVGVERKRLRTEEQLRQETGFDPENPEDIARLNDLAKVENEDAEIDHFMLELRENNDTLSSTLPGLIQEFFDLPPLPKAAPGEDPSHAKITESLRRERNDTPPATHPSAGLSYIRSKAFMENHPVHGPMSLHTPVQARVLRPRKIVQGPQENATIGVGGFVTKDITAKGFMNSDPQSNDNKGLQFDFETPGGNKLWVTPKQAHIDDSGRVRLAIEYPDKEAVAVKTGGPDPRKPSIDDDDTSYRAQLKQAHVTNGLRDRETAPPGTKENANYGSALPDMRTAPRAKGLSGEDLKAFKAGVKQATDEPNGRLGQDILSLLSRNSERRQA